VLSDSREGGCTKVETTYKSYYEHDDKERKRVTRIRGRNVNGYGSTIISKRECANLRLILRYEEVLGSIPVGGD
jgi:hypothetical protein